MLEASEFRVAIVGSGPSGFYAAEALFKSGAVAVDMFDRLPTPFGLVRGGVAPDHPKIKTVSAVFDRIARRPSFRFFGNVEIGRLIGIDELRRHYHAVILACGAERDLRLGVAGEDLPGSHTATEFVGWYNGYPDYRDCSFDLSTEVAVIIGQGNVAADVCRILATPLDELKNTDIADHALQQLATSRIRDIYLIGRRGPAQAKFSPPELRELGSIRDCDAIVDPADLKLGAACSTECVEPGYESIARNLSLFRDFANRPSLHRKSIRFRFFQSPLAILGDSRVRALQVAHCRLEGEPFRQTAIADGPVADLECGLVFRSIGYRGSPIEGVPFDPHRGIIPNVEGRVCDGGALVRGLYAVGWIKRGPSGTIGLNRADSYSTVASLLADKAHLAALEKPNSRNLQDILNERGCRPVSYDQWLRIDAAEIDVGRPRGKPREKFTRIEDLLSAAGMTSRA
jgi:ferredoxin/flavodoxin---NADP+ reductase